MKFDHDLDHSLKNLDKDIIWKKKRQQHIRDKLIDDMSQNKITRISRKSNRILPVFSVAIVIAIAAIIILSEVNPTNIALHDNTDQQTSGSKNNEPTEVINNNDNEQNLNDSDNQEMEKPDNDDPITPPEKETIHDEPADANGTSEDNSQERLLTQTEIMEAIKGQMTSDLPLKLPTEIALPEGKRLTAVTSADANSYEVIFYQHDEPIPINNKLLLSEENPAEVVARINVKKYNTQKEADEAVAYEEFDDSMGKSVKLSEGLTGYQNTEDGLLSTGWNVGRWALTAHASSEDRSVSLAKEAIAYLDEYMLPAPRQHGSAHIDAEQRTSRIVWEKETIVYTIDQINDPLKALEIAVNFE